MSRPLDRPSDPGFLRDLSSTFRVLTTHRLLPLVSVVVWSVTLLLPPQASLIGLPITIFAIGYPGTERVWFLAALRGEDFSWSDAYHRTWYYLARYFVL